MWIALHSFLALVIGTLALIIGTDTWIVVAVAIEALVVFVWLLFEAGPQRSRSANLVTGLRLVTALGSIVIAAAFPVSRGSLYAIVLAMLIAGEVSDFFDGLVARKTGATSFGGRFDAETDAFFILAIGVIAVRWLEFPRWILLAGLLRFYFYFVFLSLPQKVVADPSHQLSSAPFPRRFSLFAKSACATATILLLFAIGPLLPRPVRVAAAAVAVTLLAISFVVEAILRISGADRGVSQSRGAKRGVFRSVVTYYGVPFRLARTRRFFSQFVPNNGLVFDIGAHVGSRIRTFRSLGARVIAVEPQPACLDLLIRWYGDDDNAVILGAACGETQTSTTLRVSTNHPTLSTMSEGWIQSIQHHYASNQIEWDATVEVSVTTLDEMISRHGAPDFVKIDVEGLEAAVLRGLSSAPPALSFEFLPASIDSALESVELVAGLGDYQFNYSRVERMRFASPTWLSGEEIAQALREFTPTDRSGDIYARRRENPA